MSVAALFAVTLFVLLSRAGSLPGFDAARAFADLERQVAFGPRVPGSEGHRATLAFLTSELEALADRVSHHTFSHVDLHDSTRVYEGTNIVASFNLSPEINKRVLLAAHWDTRPTADQEQDPARRAQPIPGANDGASGVAVLLEIARVLHERPLPYGVDIVLFDLEDIGEDEFTQYPDSLNPFAIGSAAFVRDHPEYRPTYGILVDMVGDKNLRIPQERLSIDQAPQVVSRVWQAASEANADAFVNEAGQVVYDDHVAFLQNGIPVANLIHWPFPSTWHTLDDTPENCSPESLGQVGAVLIRVLYQDPDA